jgi:hypothetical protein
MYCCIPSRDFAEHVPQQWRRCGVKTRGTGEQGTGVQTQHQHFHTMKVHQGCTCVLNVGTLTLPLTHARIVPTVGTQSFDDSHTESLHLVCRLVQ